MAQKKLISVKDVQAHASAEDCWIVVDGNAWDLTEFAPKHPGGAEIITKHAGRNASTTYNSIHAPSLLKDNLKPEKYIGPLDTSTITEDWVKPPPETTPQLKLNEKPPLHTLINSYDFEEVASRTLSKKTWAFYSSAATDLITRDANRTSFDRIWFRPRILRNVRDVDTSTKIMGCDVSMPLFVSPAAMAKLVHPDGEKAIAAGCGAKGIAQCISTNASFPASDIIPSAPPNHTFFFQLYVNKDRRASETLLRSLRSLSLRAIFVTVDAPVPGKREADERVRSDESLSTPMSGAKAGNDKKGGGLGRVMGSYIDASLCWEDLGWLKSQTDLPIVLKGVQGAADARMAVEHGVKGIVVSNHGGRSLDTSPAAVLVLLELQKCCPEVFDSLEVYVDGGVRRGTDILKCLCLGATAVGIGRHFLYALNYGQEGVEHFIDVLRDELETSMKMIGVTDLSQVHPGLVNTLDVDHLIPSTADHPYAKWRPKPRL
ncbi:hypothetical protein K490DRAFT_45658 [Saccharata proteae CBS 121410]|uniref:L-lactate dehydrogenase (cytochrome) n=1 Tax=Saccharata proteae CBS 121410 TaxID=1314787 RepID=A0A9P4HQD9_9PEZI|nr:hypothetical protein K490DRAFT_45658 [Saccharata proteae CBS 121410]